MIIGFRAKGGSISETAEFVNCSRAAVVKVYRAWQKGTVQNQRRGKCGAPRAIDDRGERRLRRCVRADRRATVEQLTTKMNQGATKSVSQSTIQRTLLRLGLRSRRLVRAPMLTAVHRRRRLEFARQYSSWTSTEWRQVAFSDESRFMLHRTDGRWRIRRETSERNHPATIAGTVQAGGGSIMVWGMFSWHSLGSLIIVEGTMDQYKYASVLADHVHPYMRIVFPQDDGIFQQDNARCHTAASVRAWFEEHQDEFTVLPWPANSPDLNPIEHLWDHLDRVVRAMDPQPRNLAQLATALESAWLNIPENTFRDLCDSLPARLAAVRSAKELSAVWAYPTGVSDELGIAQSVISRLWQRFHDDGNVSRRYSTGRPRLTTPNEDRYLAVTAKRNRRSTASDLSRQLSSATGTTISRQNVHRRLGQIGLYARRPVKCVPLTATHCRLRLAWSIGV
ncbi:Transposable element Tcb1 transposase, partial [Stegodyphus mimosarum]